MLDFEAHSLAFSRVFGAGTDAIFQGQCFPLEMQTKEKEKKIIVLEISPEEFPPKLALVKKLSSKIKLFSKMFSILLKSRHPGGVGVFFASFLPMRPVGMCAVPRALKLHAPNKLLCGCSSWSVLDFPTYSSNSVYSSCIIGSDSAILVKQKNISYLSSISLKI